MGPQFVRLTLYPYKIFITSCYFQVVGAAAGNATSRCFSHGIRSGAMLIKWMTSGWLVSSRSAVCYWNSFNPVVMPSSRNRHDFRKRQFPCQEKSFWRMQHERESELLCTYKDAPDDRAEQQIITTRRSRDELQQIKPSSYLTAI